MKHIRVGIVGSKGTLDFVFQFLHQFDHNLEFIRFQYSYFEETVDIVQQYASQVDNWLFTGKAAYKIAKDNGMIENAYYLKLNGFSLSKVLIVISYKFGYPLEHISFDTIPENELRETYQELSIDSSRTYLLPEDLYRTNQDIVSFHRSLYEKGKVAVCVTAVDSVYQELQRNNIPAFRLLPTKAIIRETLEDLIKSYELTHFKRSQIAVAMIQIDELFLLHGERLMTYEANRLNLKCQEIIFDYAEKISGSFTTKGIGLFMIFSTRGSLEVDESNGFDLLDKLTLLENLTVHIGIGYGTTSYSAEKHAMLALYHTQQKKGLVITIVNEQGEIQELSGMDTSIKYRYRTENKKLAEKLEKAGVNISTYNKLLYIQSHSSNNLTAAGLAEQLQMTPRNARRILLSLEKQGLAKIIGKETPSTKGRPSSIYSIIPFDSR